MKITIYAYGDILGNKKYFKNIKEIEVYQKERVCAIIVDKKTIIKTSKYFSILIHKNKVITEKYDLKDYYWKVKEK